MYGKISTKEGEYLSHLVPPVGLAKTFFVADPQARQQTSRWQARVGGPCFA
jgi:hypothetical protein